MNFCHVFLVIFVFSASYRVLATSDSDNDVIEYLKRIEVRLELLEKRLGSDVETKTKEAHSNLKEKKQQYGVINSSELRFFTTEIPIMPEVLHMDHARRKRAANGANKTDKKLKILLNRQRPVARCLRGNFNRMISEFRQVTRKLSKTTQSVEDIEHLITPIGEKLQAMDEELEDGLTGYVNKESLFDIKITRGGNEAQFYCKKKKDLTKRLRQKCDNMAITSDEFVDALQCCETVKGEHEQIYAPVYQTVPRDHKVTPGESVSLHCAAVGNPKPTMHWSVNSENLFPNQFQKDDRIKVYENGTLKIENVIESDEGIYTCHYGNRAGQSTAVARITVTMVTGPLKCEPVHIPLCKNLGYNFTSYPNMFSHKTQEDASMGIHQFYPIVKIGCSRSLKPYLCSLYAPMCSDEIGEKMIPPCRSLCEDAEAGCEPLLNKFGFEWPKSLECERFNRPRGVTENNKICLAAEQKPAMNQVTDYESPHNVPDNIQCEELTVQECKDVGYKYTFMPNTLNHRSQGEAELQVQTFMPLLEYGCSPDLMFLLCHTFFPMCSADRYLPVCRSVCERARNGCQSVLEDFGFKWPKSLNCSRLPLQTGSEVCVDRIGA